LKAAGGDIRKRDAVVQGMRTAKIDSPRGPFAMSKAHNPIQDIYLRKVDNKMNRFVSIAVKGLEDPARGCRM
jgi:branched-chain amino acid transport system substrate-binding protein